MTGTPKTDMLKVLLVEDDPTVVKAVRGGFSEEQVSILHAPTVGDACRLLSRQRFDAIILDLNLPDGDGATVADACRQAGSDVPIIMVTANDSVDDRIAGLGRGADDYLCKPFAVEELSARLRAVLRRARTSHQHLLRYDDVELDLLARQVRRKEIDKNLSAREVDLLAYLMSHPEQVLPKDRILKEVWGDSADQDSNVLHVYANYLRNKLEGGMYPRIIHTVRGVGYILSRDDPGEEPVTELPWERSAD